MESEKIQVEGNWYYVNAESLADTSIIKLFLYKDPELTKIAKNAAGLTRMVDKNDLEDVLKESLNEERQYSQDQLKTDFLAYAKDNKNQYAPVFFNGSRASLFLCRPFY